MRILFSLSKLGEGNANGSPLETCVRESQNLNFIEEEDKTLEAKSKFSAATPLLTMSNGTTKMFFFFLSVLRRRAGTT